MFDPTTLPGGALPIEPKEPMMTVAEARARLDSISATMAGLLSEFERISGLHVAGLYVKRGDTFGDHHLIKGVQINATLWTDR